jgi:hypothetical protein
LCSFKKRTIMRANVFLVKDQKMKCKSILMSIALLSSMAAKDEGVSKYKNKELVSQSKVREKIKEFDLCDRADGEVYVPMLIALTEAALIDKKMEESKSRETKEYKAALADFEKMFFVQQEAFKRITDDERKAIFVEIEKAAADEKVYKPSVIICQSEENAKKALKEIQSSKESLSEAFKSAAKKYHVHPEARERGGETPMFLTKDQFPAEVIAVMDKIAFGKLSSIIKFQTPSGPLYALLKLDEGSRKKMEVKIEDPVIAAKINQILMQKIAPSVLTDLSKEVKIFGLDGVELQTQSSK